MSKRSKTEQSLIENKVRVFKDKFVTDDKVSGNPQDIQVWLYVTMFNLIDFIKIECQKENG